MGVSDTLVAFDMAQSGPSPKYSAFLQVDLMSRREDPYQARARELCLAAGVDPASRIERPGQRSMPAWCAYRDAARQEHLAGEARATVESIAATRIKATE